MMRTISVSTDVFAAIWAARQPGENSENETLARLLGLVRTFREESASIEEGLVGFRDQRFDVSFTEGFEIFRTYKGKDFRAKAIGGNWVLSDTGAGFSSLNQLSRAIGAGIENAWQNWHFVDENGDRQLVAILRN